MVWLPRCAEAQCNVLTDATVYSDLKTQWLYEITHNELGFSRETVES